MKETTRFTSTPINWAQVRSWAQARMERVSPSWIEGMMNPARPDTNLAPILVDGRWMQPTAGGLIAANTSSRATTRGGGNISISPTERGGADLDEAQRIQFSEDFGSSLLTPPVTPPLTTPPTDPRLRRFGSIQAAGGFSGVVNRPTNLTVGEGYQPEMVNVTPMPNPSAGRFDKPMLGSLTPMPNPSVTMQKPPLPMGSGEMLGSANQGMQPGMPDWMSVAQGLVSRLLADSRGRRKRPTGVLEMAGSYI